MQRPNLTVRTQAHTKRIVLEKGRAVGVEVFTGKQTTETIRANREVILSAGSFNSPQTLMLSGIGAKLMSCSGIGIDVVTRTCRG